MAKGIRLASLTLKGLIKEYYRQWSGAEDGKSGLSSNPRAQRISQYIDDVLGDDRTEEWENIYSGDGFGKKLFDKYDEIDQQLRDNGVSDRPIFKFARIVCDKLFEWLDAHYDENMRPIEGSFKEDTKKDFAANIILKFCLDNNFKPHDWGLIGLTSYHPDSRELTFEFFISDSKGILEDLSDSEAKAFIKDWFKTAGLKANCYEITYDDYRRFYFEGSYGKLKNVSEGYRRNRVKESLFKKRNDSTWYDSKNSKESLTKALLTLCEKAGIEVKSEELEDKNVYHFVPENSVAYEDLVFINDRPDERYYLATAFEIVNYGKNFSVAELVFNNRKPALVCRDFFESIYAYNATTKKWQNFFGKEKSDRSIRRKLEEADYTYKAKISGRWLKGDGFANSKSDADEFESETEPRQRVNQMKKDGRIRKGMKINIIKESEDGFDPIKDLAERIKDYNRSDEEPHLTSALLGDDGLQLTFEGEERDILDVMKKLYSDYDEAGEFGVIDDTFAYTCSEYDEGFVTFDIMKRPQ